MEVDKNLKEMKNELKEDIQSEMGVFKRMLEAINGVFETDSRVCRKDGLNDGLKRYHKNRWESTTWNEKVKKVAKIEKND